MVVVVVAACAAAAAAAAAVEVAVEGVYREPDSCPSANLVQMM